MKKYYLQMSVVTVLVMFLQSACTDKETEEIPLSEVPANVIEIVQNTLPGITLKKAEREIKDHILVYELKGKLDNGNEYEIKITETGTLVEVELED
jgi:uncharacterized membrane protein YkoI